MAAVFHFDSMLDRNLLNWLSTVRVSIERNSFDPMRLAAGFTVFGQLFSSIGLDGGSDVGDDVLVSRGKK